MLIPITLQHLLTKNSGDNHGESLMVEGGGAVTYDRQDPFQQRQTIRNMIWVFLNGFKGIFPHFRGY